MFTHQSKESRSQKLHVEKKGDIYKITREYHAIQGISRHVKHGRYGILREESVKEIHLYEGEYYTNKMQKGLEAYERRSQKALPSKTLRYV